MTKIKRSILFALITAGAAFTASPALAQHKDDGHSHGAAAKAPESYAAAIKEIRDRLAEVGAAVAKGDMAMAHEEADAAGSIARNLGALALKPGSGVEKSKVKDINLAGKALAEAGDRLHDAGEKKDAAGVTAAYKEMQKQFDSLDAAAPAVYFCPMHCEGAKTYDKPGKCPVCSMNLKKQTSDKFTVDVKPIGGKIEAGKPANFLFTIKDPTGLAVKTVEIVHEQPLHLLMVSKDLSWYAHEHPVLQPDGTFTFTWTFPSGGEYTLFNDFTPKDVGMQVVPVTLKVEGTPKAAVALTVDSDKSKTVDGYTVTLNTGGPIKTGGTTHMAYTISKDGKPVNDLAPYLGAMGHLVIISQNLKEFVHSHPHEEGDHSDSSKKGGPTVDFEAHFKAAGLYKGWAQFQHMGKVITVPFTFNVAQGDGKDAGHGDGGHDHGTKDKGHDHK